MSSRARVLALYRRLLREAGKWPSYGYRTYAQRRIRDAFRANRSLGPGSQLEEAIQKAEDNLPIIQRQVLIGHMYKDTQLIIESGAGSKSAT